MNSIFFGLIFIFFHINFSLNGHIIALLPDFMGYYLIYNGTRMVPESRIYAGMDGLLVGTVIWSGVVWLAGLLGLQLGWLSIFPSVVSATIQLLVTYRLAKGVGELEAVRNRDLGSSALLKAWKVAVVFTILGVVFYRAGRLTALLSVVAFVAYMFYLSIFHQARVCLRQEDCV